MNSTELEAYLAIPMPSIDRCDEESRCILYEALDDLCNCSDQLDFRFGEISVPPTIELLSDEERTTIGVSRKLSKKNKNCEVLRLCAKVSCQHYSNGPKCPEGFTVEHVTQFLSRIEFAKRISDLLVMSNIGRVGSIELADSIMLQEGQPVFCSIPAMHGHSLQEAGKIAKQMHWPSLEAVDCKTMWNWAAQRTLMMDGFDGTEMGRAICAYSRLFERGTADEPMQLLWALVGLEALYVKGKADLLQQVREKSQVLLGPQVAFKNKISQMYNFRSRFVHGDLDFPGLCLVGDAREEVGRYDDELFEAIAVAIAVLAATIQEIVRRNWSGVRFGHTVHDSREDIAPIPER